jgi:NitT/TauT family transport system substrate-binding protein
MFLQAVEHCSKQSKEKFFRVLPLSRNKTEVNHYKTEKATPLGVAFFKSRKWGESLLFSILFLFFLSACTGKKEKHSALPELQTLTFGLMPSFDGLPSLVAVRQGIYDSLDIKIDFITYASATDRDAAFLSGKLDGMLTDYPGATLLQAKGSRLRLVMETDGSLSLIASKKSNVRNPDDLKGKNISVSGNTFVEYATDEVMKRACLHPGEVNKPEINNIPLRLMMLEDGQISASFLPGPATAIALNDGHTALLNTRQMGLRCTGIVFSEKAITEKDEEIRRFITGYNLGVKYLQTRPQNEWTEILVKEFGLQEKAAMQIDLPDYRSATRPSYHDIEKIIAWLKSKGAEFSIGIVRESVSNLSVNSQYQIYTFVFGFLHQFASQIQFVIFADRQTDLSTHCFGESVSHTACDDQVVYLVQQVFDDFDLRRYF